MLAIGATLAIGLALGVYIGTVDIENISLIEEAQAAGDPVKSRTGVAEDRYVYYPGTEELGPDEMRVIKPPKKN